MEVILCGWISNYWSANNIILILKVCDKECKDLEN